jgi:two-component system cell cycle sensor histidine kinase/response regulator CckA
MEQVRGAKRPPPRVARGLKVAFGLSLALSLVLASELVAQVLTGVPDSPAGYGRIALVLGLLVGPHLLLLVTLRRLERERQGARDRERERVVLEAQRLESIGRLAGGVAHDINNVLSAITTFGSVLKEDVRIGRAEEDDVDTILKACASAHDLTRNLLGFARQGDLRRDPVAAGDLVKRTGALLARTLPKNIELVSRVASGLPAVEVDKNQIGQALLNLAVNAVDAMPDGGTLTLGAASALLDDGSDAVELFVEDTGLGMTREVQARIFEPFFTTKPEGKGTGLGLPMVYGTVRSLGGRVTIHSVPGQGTKVHLLLPACKDVAAVSSRPLARPTFGLASGTVLVVDDEAIVRRGTGRALKRLGFDPVEAANGYEAVETLRAHRDVVDVALVDLSMPGLSGCETVGQLLDIKEELRVIVMSGHLRDGAVSSGQLARTHGYLQKPFDLAQLEEAICATRPSGIRAAADARIARFG